MTSTNNYRAALSAAYCGMSVQSTNCFDYASQLADWLVASRKGREPVARNISADEASAIRLTLLEVAA